MQIKEQNQNFQELIKQHKGILIKVARIYCQDEEDRQDLIQEIMIQIWKSLHKYNSKFKISTWLYRISINVAISFYRKNTVRKKNNVPFNEQISHIQNDDTNEKREQLNLLEQFISELKEFDKALMLLYLEEKSHSEIADILGISVGNVGTKVGRIKEKIKYRFSQLNKE
ncbi:MAG: RNA polymerase sigma factor [Ignavibacteriaceae bacterium]|nr:RNA polymerase sigma factor [Ignavibacteriaceae bacterium]